MAGARLSWQVESELPFDLGSGATTLKEALPGWVGQRLDVVSLSHTANCGAPILVG